MSVAGDEGGSATVRVARYRSREARMNFMIAVVSCR
jgi:hypothetical protein